MLSVTGVWGAGRCLELWDSRYRVGGQKRKAANAGPKSLCEGTREPLWALERGGWDHDA